MFFSDFPIIRSESRLPIYLFSVGMHDQQPHTVRREGYPYAQILYAANGSGTLVLEGEKLSIPPYSAIFLPAGCPHEYYPESDVWDIRWVVPCGSAVDALLSEFGMTSPQIYPLKDIKTLDHHFRKMHEALIGDQLYGNHRAAGYLYDFLIEFNRLITATQSSYASPAVVRAIDYINTNYKRPITMEELCEVSGVSKQHLCRLFRSALSARPMEYIAKKRIQAAKQLLSETDMSVEEIAEETGFCTGSYFTKLFKRYEGLTPSQFRNG